MPDTKKPRSRAYDKSAAGQQYRNDYARDHYDRVQIAAPKGTRERFAQAAQARGMSIAQLIVTAVDCYLAQASLTDTTEPHEQ